MADACARKPLRQHSNSSQAQWPAADIDSATDGEPDRGAGRRRRLQGLAAFKTGHFDLVCLDIFMPTMDGLETMKLVRELQPAIPIIAISGRPLMPDSNSEPDFLAMAAKRAAARRLPKPFKPAALLAAVADCLAAATNKSAPDSDVAARR